MKKLLLITMLLGIGYSQDCPGNMSYSSCGSAFACNPSCLNPEGAIWCDNACYAGCFCNLGYVFSDSSYDTCILLEDCELGCNLNGDVNGDGERNVLDAVAMTYWILNEGGSAMECLYCGDMNHDGTIDSLDAVSLVSCIMSYGQDGICSEPCG